MEEEKKEVEGEKSEEGGADKVLDIKKHKEKQEKQIRIVLIFCAVVFFLFFLTLYLINESKSFNYGGMRFKKTKFGKLDMYVSILPIKNLVGNVVSHYSLNLRNNPKDLEYILINTTIDLNRYMTVSISPEANECPYGAVSTMPLNVFLQSSNVIVSVGSTNKTYAEEKGVSYTTCENVSSKNSVLIIRKGNSTIINEEKPGCYILEISDCSELQKVIERFIVGAIAHSVGKKI